MATHKPEEEAYKILEVIDKYFPKIFEGRESIKWLHTHTTQGKQREWAAIFFEEYCRPLLTHFLGGWYGVRITKGSRIDYQRYYNWDLKVHSLKDDNGKYQSQIILNDKDTMDRIIKLESGIGFIIADVEFNFDKYGKLLKWRDKYERRTTSHSKNVRMMKNSGKIIGLKAIFIRDQEMLKRGRKLGWIDIFKQGRQPSGGSRKPKYMMNLDKVPPEFCITM